MQGVRNALMALLSRDWAGLLIAALIAGLFTGLFALLSTVVGGRLAATLGAVGWLFAAALALASLRHLFVLARARRAHPPPGRLLDLGGYRVHVLAEGSAGDDRPAVVWFAGGHASGYAVHHLHRAFRDVTRSILIDRPGTGWSDTGPFPRTTAREAQEMLLALERAGERGPFILAGHSFGGLLAANIARRRPDLVQALVLLDPTPLETIVLGPRLGALRDMRRSSWRGGFACLFGIDVMQQHEARLREAPAYARALDATRDTLGADVTAALQLVEANAGNFFAKASIYRELSPEGVAAAAWDTVVYDRDLGDMPVWLVAPKDDANNDTAVLPEVQAGSADNAKRMGHFFAATRERYLATSTHARRVVAPPGSGHNFVYEQPEWTIGVLRDVICNPRNSP